MNMSKFSLLSLVVAALAATYFLTQNASYAESEAKEGWLLNYEAAQQQAEEQDRVILMEFHGSDWCPPCIQLNNEVLSKPEFKEFADKNLVLLNLDFPRQTEQSEEQKAHNQNLAQRFGVQYFPTVILVTPDGEVLDETVGFPQGGLEGFIEFIRPHIDG